MNESQGDESPDSLNAREQQQLDEICLEFESEWRSKGRAEIEPWLARVRESLQGRLLRELVAIDLEWRRRLGQELSISSYECRFPDLAHYLDEIIPETGTANSVACAKVSIGNEITVDSGASADHAPEARIPSGTIVGKYRIGDLLGEGSHGTVYRAFDVELQREVALKVSRQEADAPTCRDQFRNETRILASLKHAHIVTVYDAWIHNERCFVASELIDGFSLKERLNRERPQGIPPREAASIVLQVAQALAHAHHKLLIHRDVKSANILLDRRGNAFLVDFGIALGYKDFSLGSDVSGTPEYMSPEQARGNSASVDGRSDIYGLGVVLYESVTGQLPHRGQNVLELLTAIRTIEPAPPRQLAPGVPVELEAVCLRCLQKRPADRFPSATDLSAALQAFLDAKVHSELTNQTAQSPWTFPIGILFLGTAMTLAMVLLIWRPWETRAATARPAAGPLAETAPVRVERAELHVQRDETGSRIDSLLLVEGGKDQSLPIQMPPLDRDDRFVLNYRFERAIPWYLVHVDPAGGAAVVAHSGLPELEARIPARSGGVAFADSDPRGVNLLILVTGELPKGMSEAALSQQVAQAEGRLATQPERWGQLRAGLDQKSSAIQLPQDYLREIEQSLPPNLVPLHAVFLKTK